MDLTDTQAIHEITVAYKGILIGLTVSEPACIRLSIDGIVRAQQQATQNTCERLTLSSSVQTDYEWHEFIEAYADFTRRHVHVKIYANKSMLLAKTITR